MDKFDNITDEERAKIDAAFPPDIDTVYTVHAGFYESKDKIKQGIARPVCSRLTQKEADEVAKALNDAHEGLLYLKWAASMCFPKLQGGAAELMEAVADDDVSVQWEKLAGPHRRALYIVTALKIKNQAEIDKLKEELGRC